MAGAPPVLLRYKSAGKLWVGSLYISLYFFAQVAYYKYVLCYTGLYQLVYNNT